MSTQWGRVKLYGGKLAENCIGEGTEVLTDSGWKSIETVTKSDLVWDGEDWVGHSGLSYQGDLETIDFAGVQMTTDHMVFEEIGKVPAIKACTVSALQVGQKSWENLLHSSKV
jgi:hypothetical protein